MHSKLAAVAALFVAGVNADFNEIVIATSRPEQVDASSIYFTGVSHRGVTINWKAPGLGEWAWPILGYDIQISGDSDFTGSGVSFSTCPNGEGGVSMGPCDSSPSSCLKTGTTKSSEPGCFLTAQAQNQQTSRTLPGLDSGTTYYFRIRARNHDGEGAWSSASYGVLTHAVPVKPYTPVVKHVTKDELTVLFDTPVTTGSEDCDTADLTDGLRASAAEYLVDETCTLALSATSQAGPRSAYEGNSDGGANDRDCAATSSKTCQTVGSGSDVTAYRIYISSDGSNFNELKDPTTGMSMYPMLSHTAASGGAQGTGMSDGGSDGDHEFTITNLDPSTTYYVKVDATNAAGTSATSDAVSATTLGVPLQPKPPSATAVGETTVTLTWQTTTGYCANAEDTQPLSTPGFVTDYNDFPATPTLTQTCVYNQGTALTGLRLFASSWSASNNDWEPARRGSLSDDTSGTAYSSSPLSTVLPSGVDDGKWLEIDVSASGNDPSAFTAGSWTVDNLSQDTYYKFAIVHTNGVGDSPVSAESEQYLTLEKPVSDLKMHSEPACIYETSTPTRFVATSSGTNVFYKWQLPDGIQANAHDTRSYGSVIAEASGRTTSSDDKCQTADCSVMEFVLPSISQAQDSTSEPSSATEDGGMSANSNDFTIAVIGYNTRGQVMLETTYDIQYCGCTDPWDPEYWDQATYHMPLMCSEKEQWDGAEKTAIEGELQYYQTFYNEETHSAQVILRVDEGEVDIFLSTDTMPDPDMDSSYSDVAMAISNWKIIELPYSVLAGSTTLYVAVRGAAGHPFSRFAVVSTTRDFSRGRGERYANGQTVADSTDLRRTQLLNIEPQAFEIKTPYYDFFEYYFGRADNDMDVEIKVNCQLGCVNVYTSKIERFPSALRTTDSYAGYWTSHNGQVCASDGAAAEAKYATASFDGVGGVYGMVSFQQAVDGPVTVSVSLKGMLNTGSNTWSVNAAAVGDTSEDTADSFGCGSTGSAVNLGLTGDAATDMSGLLPSAGSGVDPATIYTGSASADATASFTLYGTSASSSADDEDSTSLLGRSVVISTGTKTVCATIFPDATITSYVGELSLMHTIRPEETVETCVLEGGNTGACTGSSAERLLFASVQGASEYAVGDEQLNNEYTIEAKIYRYRIESNLLEPTVAQTANGAVSVADQEDRRYSVVTLNNFNYYEVELSPAAYGISVEFTLAYGQIEMYTSKEKLPTQDVIGHDNLFGDVHAGVGGGKCATTCTDADGNAALSSETTHNQFMPGVTYTISIPYSEINPAGKYVFLGVLGTAPDSSYTISVTEHLFQDTMGTMLDDGVAYPPSGSTDTLQPDEYRFFTLYVGPEDEAMYVAERSHAGHRTGDLGTDPDTWGIDWTEPLTQTWVEQQRDEWDLDVDVLIDAVTDGVHVYGSSREPYPSAERGYDVMLMSSSSDDDLVIPHFTFSDKVVYVSMHNPTNTPVDISFTPHIQEMHKDQLTADTDFADANAAYACGGDGSCSGHGSCVDATCYCDNGFLGDLCQIEAFSEASDQPKMTIDRTSFTGSAFAGDSEVTVPFALTHIPVNSKVHVYVDGLPYPAKGANVLYYTASGCADNAGCTIDGSTITSTSTDVTVFGQAAGVLHTVELLLLSEDNIPLGTDLVDFEVNYAGGCANNCGNNGVCHHGYCVCFDGFNGVACENSGETAANGFVPGAGFVTYNTELMKQERDEDEYISQLKLTANKEFLAISDESIKASHDAVVTKLNDFIKSNDQQMDALASAQASKARDLHRKRDRITTTIQQMREESKRLKTANTEAYLETVRALHEGQRAMQNDLDMKRKEHFQQMAIRHDEWIEIKEKNDFKLNQLRTANGPLVDIDDLEERECTQDDRFRTSCTQVDASDKFVTQPGYNTHGTVSSTGVCAGDDTITCSAEQVADPAHPCSSADPDTDGVAGLVIPNPAKSDDRGHRCVCSYDVAEDSGLYSETCVKVTVDGELDNEAYDDIPR